MRAVLGSVATVLLLSACSRNVGLIEACAPQMTRGLEFEIVSLDRVEGTLTGGQVTYTLRKQPDDGTRYEVKYLNGCRVKSLETASNFAQR
jgi:hypothetical protein